MTAAKCRPFGGVRGASRPRCRTPVGDTRNGLSPTPRGWACYVCRRRHNGVFIPPLGLFSAFGGAAGRRPAHSDAVLRAVPDAVSDASLKVAGMTEGAGGAAAWRRSGCSFTPSGASRGGDVGLGPRPRTAAGPAIRCQTDSRGEMFEFLRGILLPTTTATFTPRSRRRRK